jgi:hypothetical protein
MYSTHWISNWPPRYLSEFLFGGPVAGPVIYYLFEILYFSHFAGHFTAGPVIFYTYIFLTTGQFAGQLSNIFSNSWGQFAIGPVADPQ